MNEEAASRAKWEVLFAFYEPLHADVLMGDIAEGAQLLARLADSAPDDAHLNALAISLIEAYLGVHKRAAYPEFEKALRESSRLRTAWCHAWSAVPAKWEKRFNQLVKESERP